MAATVYGYQVLFVDAKGDAKTAARFLATMRHAGFPNVPLFPQRPYHGWEGDRRALLNRLLAIQTFTEPFYANVSALTLGLALKAPQGLPRSSGELLHRLGLDVLRELYQGHPEAYKVERLKADEVRGVFERYAGFFDIVGAVLDGGWSVDEVDAAYWLLNGTALKEEAASLGSYLLEDLAHYIASRKPPERQVLLIIDEFSAISDAADPANLFERIRSFGAACVRKPRQVGILAWVSVRMATIASAQGQRLHWRSSKKRQRWFALFSRGLGQVSALSKSSSG